MKQKQKEQLNKKFIQFDNVFCDNFDKEFFKAKSPYVILSNKTFTNIKLNVIMLTKTCVENDLKERKIFYKIKYFGDYIVKNKKGKYFNLNPSSTNRNLIFITVALHEVEHLENLIFYTEKGVKIPKLSLYTARQGYVLLATIQVDKNVMRTLFWCPKIVLSWQKCFSLIRLSRSMEIIIFKCLAQYSVWDMGQDIIATSMDFQ